MKMKFLLVCIALAGILTSTNGCKKDDMSTGQLTGISNALSTTVTHGKTNVRESELQEITFSITSTNWVANPDSRLWSSDYFLNSYSIMNGSVQLYMMVGGVCKPCGPSQEEGIDWVALPYVNGDIIFKFEYNPSARSIMVQASAASVTKEGALIIKNLIANPGDMTFRVTWIKSQPQPISEPKYPTM